MSEVEKLRAERDAARAVIAAIERVRAIHHIDPLTEDSGIKRCVCEETWPCSTRDALDGAPGPEWEYVGMAFEHGGFMRIRNDQLVPEKFDSWRKLMAQYPRVEILKRVKAVPAGPWLPVEGESK